VQCLVCWLQTTFWFCLAVAEICQTFRPAPVPRRHGMSKISQTEPSKHCNITHYGPIWRKWNGSAVPCLVCWLQTEQGRSQGRNWFTGNGLTACGGDTGGADTNAAAQNQNKALGERDAIMLVMALRSSGDWQRGFQGKTAGHGCCWLGVKIL
jgi:hypothetical protein